MAKITLNDIGTDSFQAISRYNSNQALIEVALENTLSRDGTGPNELEAPLDMNSNRIINLPLPTSSTDAATKQYVDLQVNTILSGVIPDSADYIGADNSVRADLTTDINVVATNLNALSSTVTALTSTVSTNNSTVTGLVSAESTTRATADTALAGRLDVVEASITSPDTVLAATVASHTTAITNLQTNTATAASVTALTARVTTAENSLITTSAAVTTESNARAAADSALSTRVSSVEASLGIPSTEFIARITNVESAVVSLEADKAEASTVTALTATVNSNTASVTTNASAISTVDGKLSASYGLTVDGNGRIASMKLLSNGNTSEIAFTADSFKIFNGSSNQAVFGVSGGSVRINGNLLVSGSVTSGSFGSNAISKAGAQTNAGALTLTGSWQTFAEATINTTNVAPVVRIDLRADVDASNLDPANVGIMYYRVRRNGSTVGAASYRFYGLAPQSTAVVYDNGIATLDLTVENITQQIFGKVSDFYVETDAPAGAKTYTVEVYRDHGNWILTNRTISITGTEA